MKPEFAEQYRDLERWHWWFRGRRRILEEVLRRELPERRSWSILSLGCGPAAELSWLIPFAGADGLVVGLDIDSLHADGSMPAKYVIGDIAAAPLATGSFDAVLALDVLEHLDDDTAGMRESARLIRPGGILLITVPAWPSLWGQQDIISRHRRRYTKTTLNDVFARAQLPRPRVTYFNTLLFPPVAIMRSLRRAQGIRAMVQNDFSYNQPGLLNDLLARIFAMERHAINRIPLPIGVSLLATLRRGSSGWNAFRR